jgi:hypothetical protein
MSTSTVTPEIARFAEGVRAALADLPADEVDDLTEGLEADLTESLAEDLRRTLPDPAAYAAELRLAAGLPGRTAERGALAGLTGTWRGARAGVADAIGRNPALAAVADFLTVLRPAWWIVRAWLATWLLAAFFGMENSYWFDGAWWIVFAASVVVSVQWGRGHWAFPGLRGLIVAGNLIAVVALLPVLAAADSGGYETYYSEPSPDVSQGLSMDGQPIENIYAYDASGHPLKGVQLFDVDGKPLEPYRDVDVTSLLQTPATLETGAKAYNVYPLAVTRVIWDEFGELVPDPNPDAEKAAAYANGPFLKVPAVQPSAAAAPVVPQAPIPPEKVAQPNE